MDLKSYIESGRGNAVTLAAALGIPASYLSQMASGNRSVSPERAALIERLTEGAVTRKDTRPNDWSRIWPELAIEAEAA